MTIDEVIAELNKRYGDEYSEFYFELGKTYCKLCMRTPCQKGGSAYGFIANEAGENKALGAYSIGDIFKPASWAAPAKHARGNLAELTPENFGKCFGKYSVQYIRG
jgi:hypothetical protein